MAEQNTTGSIAPYFEQFFQQIKDVHPKIDAELLVRIMLFEINLKNLLVQIFHMFTLMYPMKKV